MSRASVANYSNPEEMEAAHIAAAVEITAVGRDLWAHTVRLDLDHLWATRVDERGSRIKHVTLDAGRMFITFDTTPGPPRTLDGREMPVGGLMCHGVGTSFYELSHGEAHWGTISMPLEQFSALAGKVVERALVPRRDSVVAVPSSESLEKFQRLHAAASVLAETAPQIVANPEAARSLEQAFLEVTLNCLNSGESESLRWAQQCHSTIMRRFRRVLEDNPGRAIYIPELCAAISVPERTLRLCCQESLGMSPKKYLTLRRMNFARRTLLASVPGETSVTDVATSYGFWHFGRFSSVYRSLFNELPSDTLSKPDTAKPPRCGCLETVCKWSE